MARVYYLWLHAHTELALPQCYYTTIIEIAASKTNHCVTDKNDEAYSMWLLT